MGKAYCKYGNTCPFLHDEDTGDRINRQTEEETPLGQLEAPINEINEWPKDSTSSISKPSESTPTIRMLHKSTISSSYVDFESDEISIEMSLKNGFSMDTWPSLSNGSHATPLVEPHPNSIWGGPIQSETSPLKTSLKEDYTGDDILDDIQLHVIHNLREDVHEKKPSIRSSQDAILVPVKPHRHEKKSLDVLVEKPLDHPILNPLPPLIGTLHLESEIKQLQLNTETKTSFIKVDSNHLTSYEPRNKFDFNDTFKTSPKPTSTNLNPHSESTTYLHADRTLEENESLHHVDSTKSFLEVVTLNKHRSLSLSQKHTQPSNKRPNPLLSPSYRSPSSSAIPLRKKSMDLSPPSEPRKKHLCTFFMEGLCRYKDSCKFIHGNPCPLCLKPCLIPDDPSQNAYHNKTCLYHSEAEASKELECQLCHQSVLQRGQKFGLLPECNDVFCVTCIKEYRTQSSSAECPICRKVDHYVVPSLGFPSSMERKRQIIDSYIEKVSKIPCKYFDSGECKFGFYCHYFHGSPSN